jgi:hypothetical protein
MSRFICRLSQRSVKYREAVPIPLSIQSTLSNARSRDAFCVQADDSPLSFLRRVQACRTVHIPLCLRLGLSPLMAWSSTITKKD